VTQAREVATPLAVTVRVLVAALAVLAFLTARPLLDPAPQAAARFALGLLVFALLVDLGRSIAGTGPVLSDGFTPHRQQAQAQVDEAYERLREALDAYVERGEIPETLLDRLALAGAQDREDLHERLAAATEGHQPGASLLAVHLVSGLVVALGVGLGGARLAEALGMPLPAPVLLLVGTSIGTLQWRAHRAGAAGTGLAIGLAGVGLFGLGALRLYALAPPVGLTLGLIALAGLAATIQATRKTRRRGPEPLDLDAKLARLGRSAPLALLAGVVGLLAEPLLAGLLEAVGLPGELVVDVGGILLATVLVFLAVEATGTGLMRQLGDPEDPQRRQRRRAALDAVLADLETEPLEDAP
jgi:F0F1-type ATP synthase assembly protein I